MKKNCLLILLAFVMVAAAYGRPKKKNQMPLVGTYWELVSIEGESIKNLSHNATATIMFDTNNKYNGNLGCNQFFGQYFAKEKTISMDYAASTKKMCLNMELETAYSKALRQDIKYYTIDNYTLYLKDKKKKIILKFVCGTKESKATEETK